MQNASPTPPPSLQQVSQQLLHDGEAHAFDPG